MRQYYFAEGEFLKYEKNYALLKNSPNYKTLNSNMAQQILKEVDCSFKSFFGLLKLAKQGKYAFTDCKLPYYLPKDGYTTLIIGFVRLNGNKLVLPFSNSFKKIHKPVEITIPPILLDKTIKEIRIIPKANARFFEIQYIYEAECIQRNLNQNNALAIDLGINNFATCVTNTGESFIIDGKKLKSINPNSVKDYLSKPDALINHYNMVLKKKTIDKVNELTNNLLLEYIYHGKLPKISNKTRKLLNLEKYAGGSRPNKNYNISSYKVFNADKYLKELQSDSKEVKIDYENFCKLIQAIIPIIQ